MNEAIIYISKLFTELSTYLKSFFHGATDVASISNMQTSDGSFLQNICIYFTSTLGIVVQVLFIFLVAYKNWRTFKNKINKIHTELSNQIKTLETIKDKSDFAVKFVSIDNAFSKSLILKNAWREFKKVVLQPGSHPIHDECIVNTQYPSVFFTESTLIKPVMNLNYFNSVPNKLTGLGIMGTFLGLVAGIYLAASGISSNNIEEAKTALSHLLDGASLGFLTSVAGLGCSLIFSWREKNKNYASSILISRINDLIEANTQFMNSEYLNCLMLIESKKQSDAIGNLSIQVTNSLGDTLQGKVAEPLIKTLDKIQNTLEVLSDNQVKASDETIKQLIEEFSQKISGAAGREMRAFAAVLQRTSTELRSQITTISSSQDNIHTSIKDTLDSIIDTFNSGSKKLKEEMNDGISSLVNSVSIATKDMSLMLKNTTGDSVENMSKAASEFEMAILKLKDSSSDIASITKNNSALAQEVRVILDSIEGVYTKMSEVVSPISNISTNLSLTSESLAKGMGEFESISKSNSDVLKLMQQAQAELKNNWNSYLKRFETVDESLGQAMEGLNNGYSGFVKSTNNYLIGLDKNSSQIVDKLSTAVRELSTVVEDWQVGA